MNSDKTADEMKLIDFHLGQLTDNEKTEVLERLERDEPFKRLHDDLAHTFAALELSYEDDPPANLVDGTLQRISHARRTEALLAAEEARRPVIFPTFSLRELGAIAAAILVMAAIFVPSMLKARREAVIRNCASHAGQIGSALLTYANENGDYLPAVEADEKRWLPDGEHSSLSNSSALYKLVRDGYASPVIFQCPAGRTTSFVVQAHMTDFPERRFIGYSYQHTLGSRSIRTSDPVLTPVASQMAILADSTPLSVRVRLRPDTVTSLVSLNHGATGQNVLYLDMHVEWAKRPTVGVRGNNIFLAEGVLDYKGVEEPTGPTDTFLLPAYSLTSGATQPTGSLP